MRGHWLQPSHSVLADDMPSAQATAETDLSRLLAAYPEFLAGIDGQRPRLARRHAHADRRRHAARSRSTHGWRRPISRTCSHAPYPAGAPARRRRATSDPGPRAQRGVLRQDVRRLPARARSRATWSTWSGCREEGQAAEGDPHQRRRRAAGRRLARARRAAGRSSIGSWCPPPAPTIAARSPAPRRVARTATASPSTSPSAHADYWRWAKGQAGGAIPYRNRIPLEIVEIFERHGFIWGGKWYHYDTMHFEYRPELLPPGDR